jgi:RNA polymerase sigma factor (sigma-70 family)
VKVLKFGSAEGVPRVWTMEDLSAFYVENRSAFVLQASRLLKDSARAEEVVQDALIRVILATPELESESHALSYFRKTVENLCLDIFRLENRRPNLVLIDDAVSEIEAASTAQFVDHSEIIAAADDAAIIRQALSLLSPAERAALVMWEMEGRSTLEIARELGISDKTVRHTIARARKSFRRILSEHVIDADRGLTALDLLSSTYRKSLEVAKKSSQAALSIILVFFAFIGFNSLTPQSDFGQVSQEVTTSTPISNLSDSDQQSSNAGNSSSRSEKANSSTEFSSVKSPKPQSVENAKASTLKFPGLDKLGLPIGFTVTDNSGSLGSLSFFPKSATFSETGFGISWLVKTSEGASNVFLSQSLRQETAEPEYDVTLSFGMSGGWIPTNSRLVSADFERLVSGNYLLTAVIQVKSAVETTIVIPASASGQDLSVLPSRVVTRVVLNPSKTQV